MAYIIKNLMGTSEDPSQSGRRTPLAKRGRVQIGALKVTDGRTVLISDETYRRFKPRIDEYVAARMIRVRPATAEAVSAPIVAELAAEDKSIEAIAAAFAEDTKPEEPVDVVKIEEPAPSQESAPAAEIEPEAVPAEETAAPAEESPAEEVEVVEKPKRRARAPKEA